ncbi:TonB-dependent receptor [Thalassotalea piscium]
MKLTKISHALKMTHYLTPKAVVVGSALAVMVSLPVSAFEEQASKIEVKNTKGEIEVIEVRGMRGTMTRSLNEKKNTAAIVDAIAAADFGDLPGLSLADIIENVSGASSHRLKGSQNEISIRGLGSYWGYSTFNGRTITNAGPGRAVNFKKFPSDLVDKIVIYKSQQADLVEGGTSGTIDVNSLHAIDYGKNETTVEATGIYNDYYSDVEGANVNPWGSKFVISTVRSWETEDYGNMGFTLGFVSSDDSNPEENYGGSSQMQACALRDAAGNALENGSGDCEDGDQGVSSGRQNSKPYLGRDTDLADFDQSSIFYVPNDAYWRTGEDEDSRSNVVATFQWQPTDQWDINLDYERSRLEYTEERMEFGLDTRRRKLSDHIIADDHTLLYAKGEAKAQLTGESRNQVDDYDGGGISVDFYPTDNLKLSGDLSYSKSYRYRVRHRTKFKTQDRYQYEFDARDTNVPSLTWLDDDRNGINDAGYNANEVFDPTDIYAFLDDDGVAYEEYRRTHEEREDKIFAAKFDVEYVLDNDIFSSIKAGVRYSEENLYDEQTNDVSLTLTDGSQRNGSTDTADNNWDDADDAAVAGHVALTNGIINNCINNHQNDRLFDEEGGGAGDFVTYDAKCFIGQMLGVIPGNNGDTSFYDIGEREDGRDGADRIVEEKITAIYAMANIDTMWGEYPVTGNVGVRVVKTDTHSDGYGDKVYITTNPDGTYSTDINVTGEIEDVTLDSSYTKVLPSINLTFQLNDQWYIKTAAYRAMSRFQMNAMSSGVSYNICTSSDSGDEGCNNNYSESVTSGSANGNHMKPYMSTNFDVSLEYYPSLDAAVTLAIYNKSFVGGYESVNEDRDIIVSLDGVDTVFPNVSHATVQTSDDSSTIKGVEITAQKHFTELPGIWSGVGVKAAYNYASSDFVSEEVGSPGLVPDANLFGFSKNVASASIYWEGDDLSLRVLYKYRSKYFQPNNLPFPSRSHRYVQDSDYLDFNVKYKVSDNVSVSLKALNLLDEPQVMTRGNDTTVSDYSRSGAKFYLGVKAKF